MNRLYCVESVLSVTGSVADHRLPVRSSQIGPFAEALEREIANEKATDAISVEGWEVSQVRFLRVMAADLKQHRGKCVVIAGSRQPPEVHAAVHRINAALGGVGRTVRYYEDPDAGRPLHGKGIASLASEMKRGDVKTLVILGGNPVYNAPADLEFAQGLKQVATRIHLGIYRNETAQECDWHLPQAHSSKSWGDARSFDGTYSVVQPLIDPLYAGRTAIELVAMLMGQDPVGGHKLVRDTFKQVVGVANWEARWDRTLHDGLLEGSAWKPIAPALVGKPIAMADASDNCREATGDRLLPRCFGIRRPVRQ